MRSVTAAVALSALSMVAAQNSTAFTIVISDVTEANRNAWCIAQENTCIDLCDNNPLGNTCDYTTLNYYCTCQNGTEPGLQYYVNTVDTFVCQEAYSECNLANVGNAKGQSNCTTTIQDNCGTLDPADYSAGGSATTSAAASGATGSSSTATAASSSAAAATSSTAGAAPTQLQQIGTGAAAAALGLVAFMF
ncbi:unnamed protein product [Discula destructiva]